MSSPRPEPRTGVEVAIVGMACLFPGAPNLDAYWRNILGKFDAITDPPPEAWDPAIHYDPNWADTDGVYCKKGGYLGPLAYFDPLAHGVPPRSVGGEPDQWLALQLARDALTDAGYTELDEQVRMRTAVIIGKGTYLNHGNLTLVQHGLVVAQTVEILRTLHPEYDDAQLEAIRAELKTKLPRTSAETVAGLIPNIIVGRIANRLDLMGPTHTVDAACASSLVAAQLAVRDLADGEIDLALIGGSQVSTPVPLLNIFCQLNALSHKERIRPFDKDADGTLLGEGIGMMVLKRLADAEQAGDRIYAVIRGVGVASDGHGASVMAPRMEGEELAVRRAYAAADVSPQTVGLIEAHGTATPVGDVVEVQALTRVFGGRDGGVPRVALGSVKSMISHTMPAAGVAGMIKTALALHHKVLPPTLNVDTPNPKLELHKTPFYLNTETRPWIHGDSEPRRAAVNAFGFGGINGHIVLEEYRGPVGHPEWPGHMPSWDAETCVLEAPTRDKLVERLGQLATYLEPFSTADAEAPFELADLAFTLADELSAEHSTAQHRIAIVATSVSDLHAKIQRSLKKLERAGVRQIKDSSGIYYFEEPLARTGKVVALFPGEGSQYPNMLADLCLHFPEVRGAFDETDRLMRDAGREVRPSEIVFPPTLLIESEAADLEKRLWQMDGAVDAVLAANQGLWQLLRKVGFAPSAMVGHSTGEFSALRASGLLDLADDAALGRFANDLSDGYRTANARQEVARAGMLALGSTRQAAEDLIAQAGGEGLYIGMDNCPHQTVIVGHVEAVERARALAQSQGLLHEFLAFDRAYHTPLFEPYAGYLRDTFDRTAIAEPSTPVWSCTTAGAYPADPAEVRKLAVRQWVEPVDFRRTIERLHEDGARVFVEVGARGALSAFVEDILRGKPFIAIPANVQRRSGVSQINHCVALLVAHGVGLDVAALFRGRRVRQVGWQDDASAAAARPKPSHKQKLMTGFPFLRLSNEFAADIRQQVADAHPPIVAALPEGVAVSEPAQPVPPIPIAQPSVSTTDAEWRPEPARQVSARVLPHGDPVLAVDSYLDTMDQFLATQEAVLRSYLGHAEPSVEQPLPLLGTILEHTPGESLVTQREYDPSEDRYLRDHTLGRNISDTHPDLLAMAVMPLTMSLEIMAEAASYLAPGQVVVGMHDVLASRWIAFDGQPQVLQLVARRLPGPDDGVTRIAVQLRNLTEDQKAAEPARSPALQATIRLAEAYPAPPPARLVPPEEQASSSWTPDALYTDSMFHGPLWRGVQSMDTTSQYSTSATLQVLPFDDFFHSIRRPRFALDPVTLDAAGQVIGFWINEHFPILKQIFPFRIEALDVYGPQRPVGEPVRCDALIRGIDELRVVSDIDMLDADGQLWMRLSGWEDKRFSVSLRLHPLVFETRQAEVSYEWPAALAGLDPGTEFECRLVSETLGADRAFWKLVWAYCVLGPDERATFQALSMSEPEQVAWLAARTAAKEAVRALLARVYRLEVPCADIEIGSDPRGKPLVGGAWLAHVDRVPLVSLSRRDGVAVAIAGLPDHSADGTLGLGIDIEVVRPQTDDLLQLALGPEERGLLAARLPMDAHLEWLHRIWCAKQAASKALGYGPLQEPSTIVVRDFDVAAGTISLTLAGQLAQLFPTQTVEGLVAHTRREGDLVVATTLCSIGKAIHATYV